MAQACTLLHHLLGALLADLTSAPHVLCSTSSLFVEVEVQQVLQWSNACTWLLLHHLLLAVVPCLQTWHLIFVWLAACLSHQAKQRSNVKSAGSSTLRNSAHMCKDCNFCNVAAFKACCGAYRKCCLSPIAISTWPAVNATILQTWRALSVWAEPALHNLSHVSCLLSSCLKGLATPAFSAAALCRL